MAIHQPDLRCKTVIQKASIRLVFYRFSIHESGFQSRFDKNQKAKSKAINNEHMASNYYHDKPKNQPTPVHRDTK